MSNVTKKNVTAGLLLYERYLQQLQRRVCDVAQEGALGILQGTCTEEEAAARLDAIEREVEQIEDCISVLKHLWRG